MIVHVINPGMELPNPSVVMRIVFVVRVAVLRDVLVPNKRVVGYIDGSFGKRRD